MEVWKLSFAYLFVCLLCELFTEPHLLLAEGFRTENDKPIKLK